MWLMEFVIGFAVGATFTAALLSRHNGDDDDGYGY